MQPHGGLFQRYKGVARVVGDGILNDYLSQSLLETDVGESSWSFDHGFEVRFSHGWHLEGFIGNVLQFCLFLELAQKVRP